jgi:GNAT superfamily N-acetyltransferase
VLLLDSFLTRPCIYARDRHRLVELLLRYRATTGVAVYPTTWRVRLLLTSRVWEPEQDTCIWETPAGQLAGFAMLWRRGPASPYLALDRFIHPAYASNELAGAMLAWGSQRAEAIAAGQGIALEVYAQDFAPQLHLDSSYERFGFALPEAHPEEYNVYLGRSLGADVPVPVLPPGYTVRPVQAGQEWQVYQSLYSFAAVYPAHLQEQFDSDEYSHLVVVNGQGQLAAYCESSISRQEWQVSGTRIGWIDYIETLPEQQGRGLGQAVLWAGLGHLHAWGAETALLVTTSSNTAALRLYAKTGFERLPNLEPRRYVRHVGEV